MTRRSILAAVLLFPPLSVPGSADDPEPAPSIAEADVKPPRAVPGGEEMGGLHEAGPILLAGQPRREDLERLARDGVSVVINLRTPREMASLPFDEPETLKTLGVDYVHIPIGPGAFAPRPEAVEQLHEALRSHQGKALIHCGSAFRATQLWAAHLVKNRGVSRSQADAFTKSVTGAPAMVEQYLGPLP
ncbi:beta-lactamase hydrolase domain-containing protein [Tautonia sociabilis]|uniref:Beta-lactamase hydrolase-like protein phosphatase-like domain-containing protein n=1 Tax=Tautonia sociabilis TaxID=2080755 RepID=A0A432MN60_9BACT|nr:sulfur transferase domain-containing protein [Tautonia sociabilis]RUL88546.1 hypothetical protein TsocGM_06385 [Tautonia sociabilis]